MKSQFDKANYQVPAAPSAPSGAGPKGDRPYGTDKAARPSRLWRHIVSKVEEPAWSVEGYCISKLPFCAVRMKDRNAGLNDPIWGGVRYILGLPGLSAYAPLPLTDY